MKREIFNELENRIESLNLNLSKLENKVAGAKTTEAVLEEKGVKDKNALAEKVYILPPTVSPRFERNELSEKFISNFSLDKLSEDFNAAPVVAQTKFALTKEKVKDLYKEFCSSAAEKFTGGVCQLGNCLAWVGRFFALVQYFHPNSSFAKAGCNEVCV